MDDAVDLNSLWKSALGRLGPDSISAEQRAFVNLTVPLEIWGDTILLAAPNDFTKDVIETRLRPTVNSALSQEIGRNVTIAVKVDQEATRILDEEMTDNLADGTYAATRAPAEELAEAPAAPLIQPSERMDWSTSQPLPPNVVPITSAPDLLHRPGTGARPARADEGTSLNPKYTFDTFVAGSSNRFAHAAAVAVAEQPAKAYNPLFIYGESGLGKTHLLHAIGFYTRQLYQGSKVRYVSSEDFTNDFINSIRDDRNWDFQRRFREIDVLLIDDIQFMSGKQQTQEEFFHTFNSLHNANKQIVLTSDLHPRRLDGFEDRLRSRFEWGLTTDVQPPELETRMAILRKKAQQERLSVDPAVLEFVASKISSNIRELEGALIRVTAYASLNQASVDVTLAQEVLHHLITDDAGPEITEQLIMVETAKYFGLTLEDLQGGSRSRTLVTARQIAMYLCRDMTDLSLPRVGQAFGGRDHTTVMHAERKIKALMSEKRSLYNQVSELTSRIRAQAKSAQH